MIYNRSRSVGKSMDRINRSNYSKEVQIFLDKQEDIVQKIRATKARKKKVSLPTFSWNQNKENEICIRN